MLEPYYDHDGVTIYHGDCREVLPQLSKESIDLVFTDPPYAREYDWCWSALADGATPLMKIGAALFTYCGQYQIPKVLNDIGSYLSWWWLFIARNSSSPPLYGYSIVATFKPILAFYRERQPKHLLPGLLPDDLHVAGSVRMGKALHEWGQAPVFEPILRFCPKGGIVLDPFLGGGTTLWAAQQHGRRGIGIEIEERHCETAARRCSQIRLGI